MGKSFGFGFGLGSIEERKRKSEGVLFYEVKWCLVSFD